MSKKDFTDFKEMSESDHNALYERYLRQEIIYNMHKRHVNQETLALVIDACTCGNNASL